MLKSAVVVLVAIVSHAIASLPSAPPPRAHDTVGKPSASAVVYPWLTEPGVPPLAADNLQSRFSPPAGFSRVAVEPKSFGAFLRTLPLAPAGTPLLDYLGNPLHDAGHHPNVAAIVAIDVGKHDLQQCADSIVRMHAEWRWAEGDRDERYRAASTQTMSFSKYKEGYRAKAEGAALTFVKQAPAAGAEHPVFRAWLDEVFAWVNTGALARDAGKVSFAELRPGDFMVMPGVPYGHAVLVLDIARDSGGKTALLLGQGYMPAQRFHVLRQSRDSVWFVIDEKSHHIDTPFWRPFSFDDLRRLSP